MPMPKPKASLALEITTGFPSIKIAPLSGLWMPPKIFIRVDLPAPFSPMSACTSPQRTSKFTWSLASTSGKRLTMFCMETAGASVMGQFSN